MLNISLVKRVLETGTSRDSISYETLKLLVSLDLAIDEVIGHGGRVLVRASGTEPLVRVMVETLDPALAKSIAEHLLWLRALLSIFQIL